MKRRTSTEAVGIWTGFVLPPGKADAELVRQELRKAHDYYNNLVSLELRRLAMYRAARGTVGETLPALEAELVIMNEQVAAEVHALRAARGAARKRVPNEPASERIKALKTDRRVLIDRIKAARQEAQKVYAPGNAELSRRSTEKAGGSTAPRTREKTNAAALEEMLAEPEWSDEWKTIARINADAVAAEKQLLAGCGLTPGTYLMVQKAVDAAFAPPQKGKPLRPDPSPKDRFFGEGRLGVQVHRLTVADLLGGKNAQVALRMSDRLPTGKHAEQRYGTLRMRVTKDDRYVDFPVKLHRPLPADGVITQIWIRVERSGPRTLYAMQCVIETPQWVKDGPVKGAGTVAIDTGWRVMGDEGIRVAYWMDDHGRHGQILVPERVRGAIDFADKLRGIADMHFNEACKATREWMRANPTHVPAWMVEETATIAQWHAHGKLIRVARQLTTDYALWPQWRTERKAAGLDLFGSFAEIATWLQGKNGGSPMPPLVQLAVYLEWWRRKDLHLYDWETRERKYAENARTDLFRKVCQVARQYEHVLVENIDLPKFARNAPPEEKAHQDWMHRIQRIAAPGDLAARIMGSCKGRSEKVPSVNNTRTCHKCRHVNDAWTHPEHRVQTCAGCGAEWDQDENACRVMLATWHAPDGERSGDVVSPAPARGAESMPDGRAETVRQSPVRGGEATRKRDRSQNGRQGPEMTARTG